MRTLMRKSLPLILMTLLASLFLAGCEDEDDKSNAKIGLVPGESKLVTVEARIFDAGDVVRSFTALLKQADLNNLDVAIITSGIKDETQGFAQLQVTAQPDATAGTYVNIVEFNVTYYDTFFEDIRSETEDASVTVEVY